jgi:hypothetical protein
VCTECGKPVTNGQQAGRAIIMTETSEAEFWKRLEFMVCSELEVSEDDHIRFLWCDESFQKPTN